MSASDLGARKRLKDKKRRRGSGSDSVLPSNASQESTFKKVVVNEKIHVQKEVKIGGNIVSKLVFILILALLGSSLYLILTYSNKNEKETPSWISRIINCNYITDQNEVKEPANDVGVLQRYSNYLYSIVLLTDVDSVDGKTENTGDERETECKDENENDCENGNDEGNENDEDNYQNSQFVDQNDDNVESDNTEEYDSMKNLRNNKYSSKYSINFKKLRGDTYNTLKLRENDDNDDEVGNDAEEKNTDDDCINENGIREDEDNDINDDVNDGNEDDTFMSRVVEREENDDEHVKFEFENKDRTSDKLVDPAEKVTAKETEQHDKSENEGGPEYSNDGNSLEFSSLHPEIFQEQFTQNNNEAGNEEEDREDYISQHSQCDDPELEGTEFDEYSRERMQWPLTEADILTKEVEFTGNTQSESETSYVDEIGSNSIHGYVPDAYRKANITNQYDWQFRDDLDDADEDFDHDGFQA